MLCFFSGRRRRRRPSGEAKRRAEQWSASTLEAPKKKKAAHASRQIALCSYSRSLSAGALAASGRGGAREARAREERTLRVRKKDESRAALPCFDATTAESEEASTRSLFTRLCFFFISTPTSFVFFFFRASSSTPFLFLALSPLSLPPLLQEIIVFPLTKRRF